MISKAISIALGAMLLTACTSVDVKTIDARMYPVKLVCIKKNPEVQI
jgi:hypothetical protein